MAFRAESFREHVVRTGLSKATAGSYASYLGRIDEAIGGLDAAITERGASSVLAWAVSSGDTPFDRPSRSDALSALRKYLSFVEEPFVERMDDEIGSDDVVSPGTVFQLEREMQTAVRRQLDRLEAGLVAVDDGREYVVATGKIDILARDASGAYVVIELKAGRCPTGALEQALGYAQSLREERDDVSAIRVVLIASDFPPRIAAAAKFVPNLLLLQYEFSLSFKEAS